MADRATQLAFEFLAQIVPVARTTQLAFENVAQISPNARVTQLAFESLIGFSPSARVTQEAVEELVLGTSQARVTQEAVEELVLGTSTVRVTQEPVEILAVWQSQGYITQIGLEIAVRVFPAIRTTQEGMEFVTLQNPTARITQMGVEIVMQGGTIYRINNPVASAGGITNPLTPNIQIKGNAQVIPKGPARCGAVTKPGPKWSVTVFGALVIGGMVAKPIPDPSYDVRPKRVYAGVAKFNPWLGVPFNARDTWALATPIPSSAV